MGIFFFFQEPILYFKENMDNHSQEFDVNGNGMRRPSVTMGIEHLLSVCKVKKSLKRKRSYEQGFDRGCNGNLDSPCTEFATLEMELRYSISTQVGEGH